MADSQEHHPRHEDALAIRERLDGLTELLNEICAKKDRWAFTFTALAIKNLLLQVASQMDEMSGTGEMSQVVKSVRWH